MSQIISSSRYQICRLQHRNVPVTPELGVERCGGCGGGGGPSHGNQGNDCRANEKIGAGRAVHDDYPWCRD